MSRLDVRYSESKRYRSRFDREPSPKRSRRDGKPETERAPNEHKLEKDRMDRDQRYNRRLQDPLLLEANSKDVSVNTNKNSSDPRNAPLPRSYFQHDDRGIAGQNGRSSTRRTESERGWWRDTKEPQNVATNKIFASDVQQKDEKSKDRRDGNNHTWCHDGYFEMETNPKPPLRKRPAFREQKIPADPENTKRSVTDPVMGNARDYGAERVRRNERWNESGRPFGAGRGNFSSRDRYRGGDSRGRPTGGGGGEKWKHDLYSEANRSPPSKNEDDQISKIEALLAS